MCQRMIFVIVTGSQLSMTVIIFRTTNSRADNNLEDKNRRKPSEDEY